MKENNTQLIDPAVICQEQLNLFGGEALTIPTVIMAVAKYNPHIHCNFLNGGIAETLVQLMKGDPTVSIKTVHEMAKRGHLFNDNLRNLFTKMKPGDPLILHYYRVEDGMDQYCTTVTDFVNMFNDTIWFKNPPNCDLPNSIEGNNVVAIRIPPKKNTEQIHVLDRYHTVFMRKILWMK